MLIVNKSQLIAAEEGRKLIGEASALKIDTKRWPDFIAVVDDNGPGALYGPARERVFTGGSEPASVVYRSSGNTVELHILNT